MTAIQHMVDVLLRTEKWKPDRFTVQREKVCSKCHKKKTLDKFAFAGSICKPCRVDITMAYKRSRAKWRA